MRVTALIDGLEIKFIYQLYLHFVYQLYFPFTNFISSGQKVHPHLLRHTVATLLLEKGMPLEQIQKFLGHSKIETTQIYAESSTEMMKEGFRKAFSG